MYGNIQKAINDLERIRKECSDHANRVMVWYEQLKNSPEDYYRMYQVGPYFDEVKKFILVGYGIRVHDNKAIARKIGYVISDLQKLLPT